MLIVCGHRRKISENQQSAEYVIGIYASDRVAVIYAFGREIDLPIEDRPRKYSGHHLRAPYTKRGEISLQVETQLPKIRVELANFRCYKPFSSWCEQRVALNMSFTSTSLVPFVGERNMVRGTSADAGSCFSYCS